MSDVKDNYYDPNIKYDDDVTFNIDGKTLNSISKRILDLRTKIANAEKLDLETELTDLRLRDKNPTLKDAWDQYQTVLALVKK